MAKKKKPTWLLFAVVLCVTIPALALLKTTVFSNNKNILTSDNSTKYDIVVDLGEGGRFESGEFSKMPDGKWIHKYLPSKNPITLPKPVKDGYIFDGWLTPGDPTPKPDYVIPPWGRENINLTAKWKAAESCLVDGPAFNSKVIENFNFNITEIKFVRGVTQYSTVDFSQHGDSSIVGYVKNNILYVASENIIYANPNSSHMFENLSNIKNITFDNFNTTKVNNMNYMFNGCSGLEKLDLINFNVSKVLYMRQMFYNCVTISEINLKNFKVDNVVDMSGMFGCCNNLSGEIIITNPDTIMYNSMFTGCSSNSNAKFIVKYKDSATKELARKMVATKNPDDHVYLYEEPKAVLMSGRDFNYALSKISGFDYVKEVKFVKGKPISGVNVAIEGEAIASIDGEVLTIASEQKICANPDSSYMFKSFGTFSYSGANLRIDKITFNNFDTSLVTNMRSMFEDCPKLISLDLRSFDTSQVTDMSRMFFFCRDITDINVSSFNTTNVTNMCSMFHMCTCITQLDLGSFNTVNVTDMSNMFQGDQYLSSLDISSFRTPNVRNMSYMFSACVDLRHIDIYNFDTRNTTDMTYMFNLCENISCEFTVMNPNCNVSGAFSGIDSLDPVSVTINYTRGCESLVDKMIKSALVGARIKKGNEVPMPVALEVRKSQLKANTQLPFDTESSKTNAPVRLILNNGTMAQYPKQVMTIQDNKIPRLYSPDLNPQYAGQFGGYYYDQQFTKPVKQGDTVTKDLTIYARW